MIVGARKDWRILSWSKNYQTKYYTMSGGNFRQRDVLMDGGGEGKIKLTLFGKDNEAILQTNICNSGATTLFENDSA